VVWLTVQYKLIVFIFTNKQLVKFIISTPVGDTVFHSGKELNLTLRKTQLNIGKIIDFLPLKVTCLIKNLIIKKFFEDHYNINYQIQFGVMMFDDNLIAHCWIYKNKGVNSFAKVH
jgi:hypothetical protein